MRGRVVGRPRAEERVGVGGRGREERELMMEPDFCGVYQLYTVRTRLTGETPPRKIREEGEEGGGEGGTRTYECLPP